MGSLTLPAAKASPSAVERLRVALNAPSLELLFWDTSGTWVDGVGLRANQSLLDSGRALTPLERDGGWVAALVHDPIGFADPETVSTACAAVAELIDEERASAQLHAQLRDGQASRARILAASDRQRRRFERNL